MNKEKKESKIFKFVISSNDGCKICVRAWNENAENFVEKIKLHEVSIKKCIKFYSNHWKSWKQT